jgi:hypothetical protein
MKIGVRARSNLGQVTMRMPCPAVAFQNDLAFSGPKIHRARKGETMEGQNRAFGQTG